MGCSTKQIFINSHAGDNDKRNMKDITALGSALFILVVFAVWHPTGNFVSSPSYWVDEAVSVEKARNFLAFGALDVAVAPDTLSGKPYATAAAGPLLTLPLAAFFWAFGIGVAEARVYMFLWLIAMVFVSYFLMRAIAGRRAAFFAILLMVTFSPLYANGKTATGDIPGFVALLLALYYLYLRKWYLFSGILLGIATTTKPSLYVPLAIVAIVEIFFSEREKWMPQVATIVGGTALIVAPWLFSLPSNPFAQTSWKEAYVFFQNPFPADAVSVLDSFGGGDITFLLHTTVLQYVALGAAVLFAVWFTRGRQDAAARIMRFGFVYALLAFVLYMRSPGWLRYLLGGTLLLFLVLPLALPEILKRYSRMSIGFQSQLGWQYTVPAWAGNAALIFLIALQAVHFFFFSWRTASDGVIQDSLFLQQLIGSDSTIGFIDSPTLASLIDSAQKYQVARISGNTVLGESPLRISSDKLPDYLFIPFNRFGNESRREFVDPYADVLETYYKNSTPQGERYMLYKKIP